jgi:hypothetical protein
MGIHKVLETFTEHSKGKAVPLQAWSGPEGSMKLRQSSPVTGLEWLRGFQEVKVKQSRYRPAVAQRVPGS